MLESRQVFWNRAHVMSPPAAKFRPTIRKAATEGLPPMSNSIELIEAPRALPKDCEDVYLRQGAFQFVKQERSRQGITSRQCKSKKSVPSGRTLVSSFERLGCFSSISGLICCVAQSSSAPSCCLLGFSAWRGRLVLLIGTTWKRLRSVTFGSTTDSTFVSECVSCAGQLWRCSVESESSC